MRPTLALRAFRPTMRMRTPVPAEDQVGHTVSQRLRKLKQIPPELFPLGVVVGFALAAAAYSVGRHFMTDGTIRIKRQNKAAVDAAEAKGHH
ncbi:hypothetical protein CkaCkLH20_04896 [Colletotrichum karsti]|uniref:NADH-ubiquinone reductase complex 1 MLRQ subunit n=1 Tax=Colletotrichum karsti TaxID=1095194 RepID=A0A9P6IC19_9PEZI|nr:uncharacterized protein CkaCkLH20_04896 [Colletotrichum karsti]KAF9877761.1 hypothetical protein CkaCkLH20_04896 [Colletotrichum karsti]